MINNNPLHNNSDNPFSKKSPKFGLMYLIERPFLYLIDAVDLLSAQFWAYIYSNLRRDWLKLLCLLSDSKEKWSKHLLVMRLKTLVYIRFGIDPRWIPTHFKLFHANLTDSIPGEFFVWWPSVGIESHGMGSYKFTQDNVGWSPLGYPPALTYF